MEKKTEAPYICEDLGAELVRLVLMDLTTYLTMYDMTIFYNQFTAASRSSEWGWKIKIIETLGLNPLIEAKVSVYLRNDLRLLPCLFS